MTKTRAFIVLAAVLSLSAAVGCSSGNDDGAGSAFDAGSAGETAVSDSSGGGQVEGEPVAAPGLPAFTPKVVRTASVELSVERGAYEDALASARSVATRFGGIVVASETVRTGADRPLHGSLTLRMPSSRYGDALAAVGRLGRVESEHESSDDVSAEYVDLESRARHLEAVERQLLVLLERADTVPAALAVQSRLNEVQLELEQTRGRIRFLDDQTSYATISLELRERGGVAADAGGWGIRDAWSDGLDAFLTVIGGAIVAFVASLPFLVLAALGLVAYRVVRRRRVGLPARG